MPSLQLLFVYNADSGLFNSMADAAHKIFSPSTYQCTLCQVTYGWFTQRTKWRSFIESLDAECQFLHRDELHRLHPELQTTALPAVFQMVDDQPRPCLDAETLNSCDDLDSLMRLVRQRCEIGAAGTAA
ncbi:MAG TPA: hypothetical protein DDY14_16210 [Chromatiaceae bacterium]|jgi:hypothetical protein|nr:MAG: hypothetical protein N838_01065 [Thiohalocapsa sp. PB-PSB1]QQO55850.1 MAG: hypothetical protein N838_23405 [Thiohalocapsa sp. PB-PSB1]HBG96827.1 hypothetical protein [Chromatiaceae bacterium]HCS89572.1 hypothetical protein [Chromatiaceae bacterium]